MFGWEAITKATVWEGLHLKVEAVPWVNRCERCQQEFRVVDYKTQCGACGDVKTRLVRGSELEIAYIEIEEPEVARGSKCAGEKLMAKIQVEKKVLNENQIVAEELRRSFREHGIVCRTSSARRVRGRRRCWSALLRLCQETHAWWC